MGRVYLFLFLKKNMLKLNNKNVKLHPKSITVVDNDKTVNVIKAISFNSMDIKNKFNYSSKLKVNLENKIEFNQLDSSRLYLYENNWYFFMFNKTIELANKINDINLLEKLNKQKEIAEKIGTTIIYVNN